MNLMQKYLLLPMVGLKSEIFACIAENFTVEIYCRTYGPPCTYLTMYVCLFVYMYVFSRISHDLEHSANPKWCHAVAP